MKKIFFLILIAFIFIGCGPDSDVASYQTKWVVTKISPSFNDPTMSNYFIRPLPSGTLNVSSTWFCDSAFKFKNGDILTFQVSK